MRAPASSLLAPLAACALLVALLFPTHADAQPQPCDRLSESDMQAYLAVGSQAVSGKVLMVR